MKTPRELLLEHHADAGPELDALRRRVIADLRPAVQPGWLATAWRELVWQPRLVWTGLAAVWLLIVGGNVSVADPRREQAATPTTQTDWLQHQRRLYAEFGILADRNERSSHNRPGPQSRRSRPAIHHNHA